MPKKTKELEEKNIKSTKTTKKATTTTTKAASKTKSASTTAKTTKAKSTSTKKSTTAKVASSSKSKTTAKKASTVEKTTTTKKTSTAKKTAPAKKQATSKSKNSSKTSSTKRKTTKPKSNTKTEILEYYDLPFRYNQTVVKILAQTPNTMFVYWDISDEDRNMYSKKYGQDFFEKTRPVLIIHNRTKNYSFEIEINDFANSWYFNVNDEKCDYEVELGRRSKFDSNINIENNYLYVTSSNRIEVPNDHILFEKDQKTIYFRNVKTNATRSQDFATFEFLKRVGRIYKINDIYNKIYNNFKDYDDENISFLNNPSSRI